MIHLKFTEPCKKLYPGNLVLQDVLVDYLLHWRITSAACSRGFRARNGLSLEGFFSKAFGLFLWPEGWVVVLNSEFFHLRFVDTFCQWQDCST